MSILLERLKEEVSSRGMLYDETVSARVSTAIVSTTRHAKRH